MVVEIRRTEPGIYLLKVMKKIEDKDEKIVQRKSLHVRLISIST